MMKKIVLGAIAGLASVGLVAGCGTGHTPNSPKSVVGATASNGANSTNTATPNEINTSNSTLTNATSPNTVVNSAQSQVYVFSQPMLKAMYAVEIAKSAGPIEPSQAIAQDTRLWSSKVSPAMLAYVPAQERSLDEQLINSIHRKLTMLQAIPGYTLKNYQTPAGGGSYWWPTDNQWPQWVDPVVHNGSKAPNTSQQGYITLESVQVANNGLILALTHGNMQTAYQNPTLSNGLFTVALPNVDLASSLRLDKTYTQSGMYYVFTDKDSVLQLNVALTHPANSFTPEIGGGDTISFTFQNKN
ncbi:hypothetical protein [Alicyclobacillus sp. ALC3]|uniref:hypothetical protein n=1 Tax=Alicyclobacillus sp. ALC3 TaxID=2796143 RepID=UPI002379D331|nr:hypothetical protein [Alicyclobacillus sp. ALC3]WDL95833.1 hypothetical protein JC200_15915 [Alicyclobacillus sp. ALC3]